MLKTTFCPDCGKPYDVSLGECPVCARRRMEAEGSGVTENPKKKRISFRKKKAAAPEKTAVSMGTAAPELASNTEEPTVQLNWNIGETKSAASNQVEAAAKSVGQGEKAPSVPAGQKPERQPVQAERVPDPEIKGGVDHRLIVALAAAILVLLALVFSIGWMLNSSGEPASQPEVSSTEPAEDTAVNKEDDQENQKDGQDSEGDDDGQGSEGPEEADANANGGGTTTPTEPATPTTPTTPSGGDQDSGETTPDTGNGDTPDSGDNQTPDNGEEEGTTAPTEPSGPVESTEPTTPEEGSGDDTVPEDGGTDTAAPAVTAEPTAA